MNISSEPNISDLINSGFDVDKNLTSRDFLLYDLDKDSQTILGIIGKEGPTTEYKIGKIGYGYGVDRHVARRRLIGIESSSKSLVENNFVIKKKGSKYRNTGNYTQLYYLTFKGIIASLANTRFEENYLIKNIQKLIMKLSNNNTVSESFIQCIKYNLAFFMISHTINGLSLTNQKNLIPYYHTWISNDPLMDPTYPYPKIKNKKLEEIFLKIRYRFYVAQTVFSASLSDLMQKPLYKIKSDSDMIYHSSESIKNEDLIYPFLREWYYMIERIQFKNINSFEPRELFYDDEDLVSSFVIDKKDVKDASKMILNKLKIKKPDISELPFLWG